MPRLRQLVYWSLRIFVGVVFCLSAVAKLVAIDDFELYIYSYGFLSLNGCFLLARVCIGFEFFLGVLTLVGWYPRLTRLSTLGLLLLFSFFLCYAMLVGRNDSCRCFGRLFELNPAWSLLKNAVLIVMVLGFYGCSRRGTFDRKKWKMIVVTLGGVALLALPFVVSVPDSWLFGPSHEPYNKEALKESLAEGGVLRELGAGRERCLVAFVTPKCPYCQLARRKLDSMVKRHHFPEGRVLYVEPDDISTQRFLDITYGNRPLVMLLDADSVVATYHLRNIDERQVADFLGTDCFYKKS